MAKKRQDEAEDVKFSLSLPVEPPSETSYSATGRFHVDIRLGPEESRVLAAVQQGLNRNAARLTNGRFVQSRSDAIRFLLQEMASQYPSKNV